MFSLHRCKQGKVLFARITIKFAKQLLGTVFGASDGGGEALRLSAAHLSSNSTYFFFSS